MTALPASTFDQLHTIEAHLSFAALCFGRATHEDDRNRCASQICDLTVMYDALLSEVAVRATELRRLAAQAEVGS